MKRTIHEITLAELSKLTDLVSSGGNSNAVFEFVDQILRNRVERKLLTILKYMPETHEVERIYSSHTELYPVGGRKQNVDSLFGRTVLHDAKPMIFHNDADVVANFPDFEKIRGLGVSGMICMPIIWQGKSIASINISGEAGQFGDQEIPALTVIAGLIAPVVNRNPVV